MAAKTEGKQRVKITSLADLQPRTVDIEIVRDNEVLVIPCKTLSYAEFQRLGYDVVDPSPPVSETFPSASSLPRIVTCSVLILPARRS
jgi:hypothetical protein